MPEMRFTIRWPDGATESCYSPSLVVRDHLVAGEAYRLDDFLDRTRTALAVASERVQARYGFPCSRALGQLARIEQAAAAFADAPEARVQILSFET
jgi:uncharacterized repeat protein (TIGR04042 family)